MNIQTHISNDLWGSIASAYESGNYTHAIIEAVHHLTIVLRGKSGADGDGVALVGQALGGDAPKLRVNALQSETDRNIQKGIEQLLRGIYLAIRNPRSHDQFRDSQEDADAIIHFVNYVLRILNASTEAFTVDGFISGISDPEFVESQRYSELLLAEIPANRRGDVIIAVFNARRTVELRKLRYLIPTLLALLNEAQVAQYMSIVSDELRIITDDADIRTALQMLTPELWPRVSEAARIRIENKLLRIVRNGESFTTGKTTGSLGTWTNNLMKAFTLRKEAASILNLKLSLDSDHRRYVARYFMPRLPEILTEESEMMRAIRAISVAVRNGDNSIREELILHVRYFPSVWQSKIAEALKDVTNPSNPAVVLDDGTPLLEAPTATEITDEDIPF